MKNTLLTLIIYFTIISLNHKCANPQSPTGGVKDTIPPTLINSIPFNNSINYTLPTITITFDENIIADKLKNKLLITPITDISFKHIIKKNKITIELNGKLKDSTTYTFNFLDGITDITERNPPINLKIAFSTGPYIDSLSLTGYIFDLYSQSPSEGYTIALYAYSDTLDYTTDKPLYFSTSDKNGSFILNNIKNGSYKLFGFLDENNNLLFDASTESHAVKKGIIKFNADIDSINLSSTFLDASLFKLISARPFGAYFEIRYSKELVDYNLTLLQEDSLLPLSHISTDKKIVRVYNTNNLNYNTDSIGVIIQAYDTLQKNLTDTLYATFKDSNRKKDKFFIKLTFLNDAVTSHINAIINSNKPILSFDISKVSFKYKQDLKIPLSNNSSYSFNKNNTVLTLNTPINWNHISDTINYFLKTYIPDSVDKSTFVETEISSILFNIDSLAIVSADNDSSEKINKVIHLFNSENFGKITINITTDKKSFIVQLIDKSGRVIDSRKNSLLSVFDKLSPGEYTFRVLIDTNTDNFWSSGNPILDMEPEEIYLHNTYTILKANWEEIIDNISF